MQRTADETSFITPIQRLITGAITKMSGTVNFMARSRRFVQQPVLDLTAAPWQGMQRDVLDMFPPLHVIP